MDKLAVRQAVAHGARTAQAVDQQRSTPGAVWWRRSSCRRRCSAMRGRHDLRLQPEKAKQLLEQAGLTLPVKIDFWYPTDVSRPYMPDPKRNFEALAASLKGPASRSRRTAAPWSPDYLGEVDERAGGHLYLIGGRATSATRTTSSDVLPDRQAAVRASTTRDFNLLDEARDRDRRRPSAPSSTSRRTG